MRNVSATLKTAVLAPTPSAIVSSVTEVHPGERRNERRAKTESISTSLAIRNTRMDTSLMTSMSQVGASMWSSQLVWAMLDESRSVAGDYTQDGESAKCRNRRGSAVIGA